MQRVINNTFTLTAYTGSKTYVTYLTLDKGMLHQFYDRDGNGGAGSVSPDWTTPSNQPKFHAECYTTDGEKVKIEKNANLKLYYNNAVVEFNTDTKMSIGTYAGMFKYEDVQEKEGEVRYYSIIKNVASAGNMDNDYIRIEGQILTEGNNVENIQSPTATIQIIPVTSGGTAYIMQIDAPAIKNGEKSTELTAKIFESNGNKEVEADSYEDDREAGRKFYKQFVMNNDDLDALLEEKSLYWNDDKDIVDTFVLKTIKRFDPDNKANQELLPEYKDAEDRDFARKLFRSTILNGEQYQRYMSDASRNWDFSRLAYMDVVIMQIAIAELVNFPNIPATVTINEYVDLAKAYSTHRSGGYVNGMLDNIGRFLIDKGIILKELPARKEHRR